MSHFNREQFISDLRDLISRGVAFRHQGKGPETGLDCIHFPRFGYQMQGLSLPEELDREFDSYTENPDGHKMLAIMRKWFIEIPVIDNSVPDAKPADLLVFYVFRNPKHIGIITRLEPFTVVEAWRAADVKIGKLREQEVDIRQRIAACFRIPDFE